MRKSLFIMLIIPLFAGCAGTQTGRTKSEPNTFKAGYQRGRSDSIKEYYWYLQLQQRDPQNP